MIGDKIKKPGAVPEGQVRFNCNLSKDLLKRLRVHAAREDKTMSKVVESWIKDLTEEL